MSDFERKSEVIKEYMRLLHGKVLEGELPDANEIDKLTLMFHERDRKPGVFDQELFYVMRGVAWGMTAMRQIVEGNDL